MVGNDDLSKAYQCYDLEKQRIIISKDVYFDETQLGIPPQNSTSSEDQFYQDLLKTLPSDKLDSLPTEKLNLPIVPEMTTSKLLDRTTSPHTPPNANSPISPSRGMLSPASIPSTVKSPSPEPALPLRRSQRQPVRSILFKDYHLYFSEQDFDTFVAVKQDREILALETDSENFSFREASQDSGWIAAMQEEMHSIAKNGTWDLIPLPTSVKPISTKWVFKNKVGLPRQLD